MARKRVTFTGAAKTQNQSNYADHSHMASLSRRRDVYVTSGSRTGPTFSPNYFELKASKDHPGLQARGHYNQIPDNGGAFSDRISHPRRDSRPTKDGKNAFHNYIETMRRNRIQRQSYAMNHSFASMRTMHDITGASPFMTTANRMRGAERIRYKLDLRPHTQTGLVGVGYADVVPMAHPPTYTVESFKALEQANRQSIRPQTMRWDTNRASSRRNAEEGGEPRSTAHATGLLGAFASAVKGMATNAVRSMPKALQERQVKDVIRSAALELGSPQPEEKKLCTVCMENEANMKFYPCNHEVTCETCYEVHAKRRGRGKFCPVCRSVIYSVEKAGIPYMSPKTTSAIMESQAMLPSMGIKSIKLREPREPFVIKEKPMDQQVYTTLPEINFGL